MTPLWSLPVCACATLITLVNASSLAKYVSLDFRTLPQEEKALHTPAVAEVVDVLRAGLAQNFQCVSVEAVESPDLTQPPYHLTSPGLTGNVKLVDIGGLRYLVPNTRRDRLYDLVQLLRHLGRDDDALLVGAGAGPWPYVGVNSEGIINLSVRKGRVEQKSRAASVTPVGAPKGQSSYLVQQLPADETRVAHLANLLLSDGKPGTVIKVDVKKRIGSANFVDAIREALKNHYGDKVVGLGGAFRVVCGRVVDHVLPDAKPEGLCTDQQFADWLHYFEYSPGIVHVGTLVTGDLGLNLTQKHFHGWSGAGEGGHYEWDTTPDTVHYEGYFTLAQSILRIDAPTYDDC